MPLVTFYFQLHQPCRLHPDRDKFLWEEKNREIFVKVAEKCYLPATRLFTELVQAYPHFRITLGMSGTFLEQAEMYQPAVIEALQALQQAGSERECYGIGLDANIVTASIQALLSGVNRLGAATRATQAA